MLGCALTSTGALHGVETATGALRGAGKEGSAFFAAAVDTHIFEIIVSPAGLYQKMTKDSPHFSDPDLAEVELSLLVLTQVLGQPTILDHSRLDWRQSGSRQEVHLILHHLHDVIVGGLVLGEADHPALPGLSDQEFELGLGRAEADFHQYLQL